MVISKYTRGNPFIQESLFMFNLFKKKDSKPAPATPPQSSQDARSTIRQTLFGDQSPDDWPKGNMDGYPWSMFVEARDEITQKGNMQGAVQIYKKITETPGLEARHYLQAWYFLRKLKVEPSPEVGRQVYGVVVDVVLKNGPEFVAAYTDHTARYFNYNGSGIIWEANNASLNEIIDALLGICQQVANQLQPINVRPNPPQQVDTVQINILTPSGIRHGIGTFDQLSQNASANEIVNGATYLMKNLVDKKLAK